MPAMTLTPTCDRNLPLIQGDFPTIVAAMDYAAQGDTGINFYSSQGELTEALAYRVLRERVLETASRLSTLALPHGARVAVVAETGAAFLSVFYACQYAGLVPCPLPFSTYAGGKAAWIGQMANMMHAANARVVIAPASVRECVQAAAADSAIRVLSFDELFSMPAGPLSIESPREDDIAYVQYSSGATSQPKGVLISQRAVSANVQAILQHGMRLRPGDRAFSWLPFYHDMGLVGFSIAALYGQCSVDYLSAQAFARRPVLWLTLISENRSTITYSPAFGYRLAAQRLKGDEDIDLSCLRIAGIGGDMVRPQVLEDFARCLGGRGFRASAFMPSYGMAEATLAVSIADVDTEPLIDASVSAPHQFVGCGRPLPGVEVIVTDDEQCRLPDRKTGHVWVRGPSLMSGYLDNPHATACAMRADGFLATGDLGYLADGQIVITGRTGDMMLIRGRNIWLRDIEWAIERIAPLKEGDVAAIAVEREDEDELVVLVQCRLTDPAARETLRGQLTAAIGQAVGVLGRVEFVPPRSLPFTSSGKLSRAGARRKYIAGEFGPY